MFTLKQTLVLPVVEDFTQEALAQAEAILSGHTPTAGWPWGDGGQTDEDQGSTADDPDPEPEEGAPYGGWDGGDDDDEDEEE